MRYLAIKIIFFFALCSWALADDSVLYLQPSALSYIGIYNIKQIDPNLNGSGIKIASVCRSDTYEKGKPTGDFAVDVNNSCFLNSNISFFADANQPISTSKHSTAIAAILVGSDPNAYFDGLDNFYYEGSVPQASLDVYEFWHFLKAFVYPANPPQADIITFSLGQSHPSWWTRGIERISEDGILIIAGIGNGTNAFDSPLYPAAGVNCIGVGVIDCVLDNDPANYLSIFTNVSSEFSSIGPAKDNVCKPDIVAAGNCLVPDGNNGYEPSGSYSSFAAPIVAGAAGLLLDKAKSDPNLKSVFDANNADCVIKAILMSSADKLPFWHKGQIAKDDDFHTALDYAQGAGMLNALSAFEILTSNEKFQLGWENDIVDNLKPKFYHIKADANELITITLVWKRYFQQQYPFEVIENKNLKLQLWAIDGNNSDSKILMDVSDCSTGAVEHIYFEADANYADYLIEVSFSQSQPQNSSLSQQFALAYKSEPHNYDNSFITYDLNSDGIIDINDYKILFDNLGKDTISGRTFIKGDFNSNGKIDTFDIEELYRHQGQIADWKSIQ